MVRAAGTDRSAYIRRALKLDQPATQAFVQP
jgi:hypothetical protein